MPAVAPEDGRLPKALTASVRPELGRRHARAQHPLGRDRAVLDGQAAERGAQPVERQADVEQRPEEHVARDARKAVDVSSSRHVQMYRSSFMLQ